MEFLWVENTNLQCVLSSFFFLWRRIDNITGFSLPLFTVFATYSFASFNFILSWTQNYLLLYNWFLLILSLKSHFFQYQRSSCDLKTSIYCCEQKADWTRTGTDNWNLLSSWEYSSNVCLWDISHFPQEQPYLANYRVLIILPVVWL